MAVDYQNIKHKSDVFNATTLKLRAIENLEADSRRQAIAALSKKASEYVANAYSSAPAAVKAKHLDTAIQSIVPELTTRSIALQRTALNAQLAKKQVPLAADDPVKLLFDEFLSTPRSFEQLGVENFAVKYMERRKAEAEKATAKAKH